MWKLFQQKKGTISDVDEAGFRFAKMILSGKRVVIADDNGGTLKWLRFTLEEYHAAVYTFKHGKETIDFIEASQKEQPIDALILDLHMNRVGGLEIAKFNASLPRPACVMFLTGCNQDSDEYKEAESLAVVLQKPVDIEKILSVLMRGFVNNFDDRYEEYKHEHSC